MDAKTVSAITASFIAGEYIGAKIMRKFDRFWASGAAIMLEEYAKGTKEYSNEDLMAMSKALKLAIK